MAFSLVPDRVTGSVFDLSPQELRAEGIRLVLADLDNTLARYGELSPSPALRSWKEALNAEGVTLFVVSNSRKSRRCPDFCEALDVDYICHAGKPGTRAVAQALRVTGCQNWETVMAGDQIFTDTLAANRSNVTSVLVKPIAWGKNPLRIVRYLIESPFRWMGKRK